MPQPSRFAAIGIAQAVALGSTVFCGQVEALGQSTAASRPAVTAQPRTDANSQAAHRQLVEKAKAGHIDLYFVGDSITRRWGTSDAAYQTFYENWKANFWGWNAGNFGWGADGVRNILWRMQNGELDGVNPKAIVLLAGTNDVGARPPADESAANATVASITSALDALIATLREKAPHATIIVTGIFPRDDNPAARTAIIDRVNAHLAQIADGRSLRYVNINDQLVDENGKLRPGIAVDGLHLDLKGYQIWADAIEPHLTEILGQRKDHDDAPPPTGDPRAASN